MGAKSLTAIRVLLGERLNVKRARLYVMVKQVSDSLSISTSDGILLLAAKNGINLHRHGKDLPAGTIERIRGLLPFLNTPTSNYSNGGAVVGQASKRKARKVSRVKLIKGDQDPILGKNSIDEMKMMAPVYELLYQMENSIRQFITRVLTARRGRDWWGHLAPRGLRETVDKRMADERINAWHQKRSTEPINYLDLDQLPALVRQTQADFIPHFFSSVEWFQQFIDEVYRSRCVVCHMNPLIRTNIDAVHVRFNQWQQLMKYKLKELQTLEAGVAPTARS